MGIIVLAAAFFDMSRLSYVLSPFFTGLLIAMIVNVPMSAMEECIKRLCLKKGICFKPIYHSLCLFASWLMILCLVAFLCCVILPMIISSLASVGDKLPYIISHVEVYLSSIHIELDAPLISKLIEKLAEMSSSLIGQLSSVLEGALSAAAGAVISIYILANKEKLKSKLSCILSAYLPRFHERILSSLSLICGTFSKYFCGIAIEALILGLIYFLILTVFGFPYSLPISLICALLSLIPYAGPLLACASGFLIIFPIDNMSAVFFLIIFAAVQLLEGQLIYPKVVGKSIGLSPMWTLFAALIGARLGGFFGAMMLVPCFSAAVRLINMDIKKRLSSAS